MLISSDEGNTGVHSQAESVCQNCVLGSCAHIPTVTKETTTEKSRALHETCQDTKETGMSVRDFDAVRSNIFNILSIR